MPTIAPSCEVCGKPAKKRPAGELKGYRKTCGSPRCIAASRGKGGGDKSKEALENRDMDPVRIEAILDACDRQRWNFDGASERARRMERKRLAYGPDPVGRPR